ncbi:LuxR C-terminal-related transcriptional regulator [Exilibacterium tricleocarpae]|nr:LuxR C-terminal-related transcriptional regulator [Exilibacterium tricleocarpae]
MDTALQSLQTAALTGRQREILSLVAKGFTNVDIGELLGIARGTVKNHVATIIERLEVSNRTEASTLFLQAELQSKNGGQTSRRHGPRIAVLPFRSAGTETCRRYVAQGLGEAIIQVLTNAHRLQVLAPESPRRLQEMGLRRAAIGRQLQATHIVQGLITFSGEQLRIRISVYDCADDSELLVSEYPCTLQQVFTTQAAIAAAIAARLKAAPAEDSACPSTAHTEAAHAFWRGRFFWNKRTPEDIVSSLELFQQSINASADFTLAYVGIADACHQLGMYTGMPTADIFQKARDAAQAAVQLDQQSAQAQTSLAYSHMVFDWDFERAEQGFRRALDLDENYSWGYAWHSYLCMLQCRFDEALALVLRAQDLDPLSAPLYIHVGHVYRSRGLYDQAIAELERCIEMEPLNIRALGWLAATHAEVGQFSIAEKYIQRAIELSRRHPHLLAVLGYIYGRMGESGRQQALLDELQRRTESEFISPLFPAMCLVAGSDHAAAMGYIERALQQRAPMLLHWLCDPMFRHLSDQPGYRQVAEALGLPVIAGQSGL